MQEARKASAQKQVRPPTEVQAVLDLPDSPKNKNIERDKKDAIFVDANSKETRQMIEEIRARQEREKQILLEEHNRKIQEQKEKE